MEIPASVLVVDDEPMVCAALADFLRDHNLNVTTVGSAEAALQAMDISQFEVLIVDLCLPGIDGEKLILKAHAKDPYAKFLIHTGSATFNLSAQLTRIGIEPQQVFLKPLLNLGIFLSTLDSLITQRRELTGYHGFY